MKILFVNINMHQKNLNALLNYSIDISTINDTNLDSIDLSQFDFNSVLGNNLSLGIIIGLILGQPLGILFGSFVAIKIFKGKLPAGLSWNNIVSIGFLAGIGFTVALLISELTFDGLSLELAKISVVLASLFSALIASVILRINHKSNLTSTI